MLAAMMPRSVRRALNSYLEFAVREAAFRADFLLRQIRRQTMNQKMLQFYVPDDKELLAALGEVTLRHEHLSHILKMTIKSIAGLTVVEALDATQYDGARQRREYIRKLARKKLGTSESYVKLSALLTRAERLTDQRNRLTRGIWAKELNGAPGFMNAPGEIEDLPSVDQLKGLACDLLELTQAINAARLEGFLKEALDQQGSVQ